MKWTSWAAALWAGLAALTISGTSGAETPACGEKVTRANLVSCALKGSSATRAGKEAVVAAEGRKEAANTVLPSAPNLSVSVATRSASGVAPVLNVYTNLSQEIEIAGQRGARQKVAEADVAAEENRKTLTDREIAVAAWKAYFEALASKREADLLRQVESLHLAVQTTISTASDKGLSAGIDADLADAAALRATSARLAAERQEKTALATLSTLWGRAPAQRSLQLEGDLTPLASALELAKKITPKSAPSPLEAHIADSEQRSHLARVDLLERSRVPNLTLSVFVQRDGFNETVIGGGISLPIVLPHPVTRTNAGEIAEAAALARKAAAEAEGARSKAATQLNLALADVTSRKTEVDALPADKIARAETSITNLATEVREGRLSVRDAAPVQQALLEVILNHIQAKRALCLASVELARAAGMALEEGAQ